MNQFISSSSSSSSDDDFDEEYLVIAIAAEEDELGARGESRRRGRRPSPMSLVAYDASDDEEDAGEPPAAAQASPPPFPSSIGPQPRPSSPSAFVGSAPQLPAPPPAPSQNVVSTSSSNVSLPTPSLDLPDVAALFTSPSLPSRGSAAMVDNSSRKRESNGSAFQGPRSKFPRVQSPQSRGARSAPGNTLVPPQLSGRSNVVTEDMSKLFMAKRKE